MSGRANSAYIPKVKRGVGYFKNVQPELVAKLKMQRVIDHPGVKLSTKILIQSANVYRNPVKQIHPHRGKLTS